MYSAAGSGEPELAISALVKNNKWERLKLFRGNHGDEWIEFKESVDAPRGKVRFRMVGEIRFFFRIREVIPLGSNSTI